MSLRLCEIFGALREIAGLASPNINAYFYRLYHPLSL